MGRHPLSLSGSQAQAFLRCPRYYQNAHVHKRQPRDVDGALSFGTAWHESRAAYWNKTPYSFAPDPTRKIRNHELAVLRTLAEVYSTLWPRTSAEAVMVENRIEVDVAGVPLSVKLDALIKETNGGYYVVEHKTTSSDIGPEAPYWEHLRLDNQISWYWLAMEKLGYKLDGVLYDVVRKPALRRGKSESGEEFTERCVESIKADHEKHFAREIIPRERFILSEAENDLIQINQLVQLGLYPKATRSCYDWFRRCEYHDVCSGAAKLSDNTMFEESTYE